MANKAFSVNTNQKQEFDIDPNIKQRQASDPLTSVWVGASAGTGKTKILTDRVLRLMLPTPNEGIHTATSPEKILCITFTKAAAAEMALRINSTLSDWAVMSDEELSEQLYNLTGDIPDEEMKRIARRLFAHVVDTAGGMKIMTIHSFCQSVLRRFPIEAQLSPHFEVMDERTAQDYLSRCQSDMIHALRKAPDSSLTKAFKYLTPHLLSSDQMDGLLKELTSGRSRLSYLLKHAGGYDSVVDKIYKMLGVNKEQTAKNIIDKTSFNTIEMRKICDVLTQGSKTDIQKAEAMRSFLEEANDKSFINYRQAFLTDAYTIRARLATKKTVGIMHDIVDIMLKEAELVLNIHNKIQSLEIAKITAEVLRIGDDILERYKDYKQLHALLDYDDLIYYTRDLLKEQSSAAWVLYKLDGGIDHILVDEAQDTSPDQWQVISALTEEFFSGHGRDDDLEKLRTLFVVGDEKQSIFSFNNADPIEFFRMQNYFAECVENAQKQWAKIDLDISFRSTPEILSYVDTVFSKPEIRDGVVVSNETNISHHPFRYKQPGLVELWPVISTSKQSEGQNSGWQLPTKIRQTENSGMILADKIADTIQTWLNNKELLTAKNRVIEPKDIMILVRTRKVFVEQCVRALKQRNIPVAGVDRMVLNEQLAIMDLMALAQFCLLPDDDLTLATILKSPLIGLNDDDLFDICYGRKTTVWRSLRDNKKHENTAQYLIRCIKKSKSLSPYSFFAELLNQPCPNSDISGRNAVLSRLGYDALDPLDELLNSCFQYVGQNTSSLQGFLQWFTKSQAEVKREQKQDGVNQVRIMTVHGSKGLQAPIVFLPDTTSHPKKKNASTQNKLLWKQNKTGEYYPIWSPRASMDDIHYTMRKSELANRENEEYKRLLYVALTRAEDRLYICGYKKKLDTKIADDCWYNILQEAIRPVAEEITFDINGVSVQEGEDSMPCPAFRLQFTDKMAEIPLNKSAKENRDTNVINIPDWCNKIAPNDPTPAKPLVPSKPKQEEPATRSPLKQSDDKQRFKRGLLIHKLLEIIPSIQDQEQRDNAIKSFLARPVHQVSIDEQKAIYNEVKNVLEHSEFAPIFGINSKAEVPFHGRVQQGDETATFFAVSGVIDRLLVTENDIYIIDYKTNRPPPSNENDVPEIYLKQMEMYKTTLQKIYPDKKIHTALLWTDGALLMPLSL